MFIDIYMLFVFFLFLLLMIIAISYLVFRWGVWRANRQWQNRLPDIEQQARQRSQQVIRGYVAEQFAPFLPGFPFEPSACHFLGRPVDFVVFNQDWENEGKMSVVFVEVKSGKSQLSDKEKKIKEAVLAKQVFWYEYRFSA